MYTSLQIRLKTKQQKLSAKKTTKIAYNNLIFFLSGMIFLNEGIDFDFFGLHLRLLTI